MTQIGTAKDGQSETLTVEIAAKGAVRLVTTKRGPASVVDFLVKDATGTARLSLWGETADGFEVGDHVTLTNVFTGSYKSGRTFALGEFGSIAKVASPKAK